MAKLVIPRGLPASGKSTAIQEKITFSSAPAVRVGRDFLRDQLFGTRLGLSQGQENLVSLAEKAQVESFLKAGVDVYVDAMHLKNKYVTEWAKLAAKMGATLEIWDEFLSVPLEECIRRDAERGGEAHLGEDVIRGIHKRFFPIPPLKLAGIEKFTVEPYVPDPSLPPAYIFDIDGTMTTGPRDRSPYDWMSVGNDWPNEPVIETAQALACSGYKIIFLSGRNEVCRPQTEAWLLEHYGSLFHSAELHMRPSDRNGEKDFIIKRDLFDNFVRGSYNVIGVYDDRPQVIRTWKSMGLQVFDVAQSEEF